MRCHGLLLRRGLAVLLALGAAGSGRAQPAGQGARVLRATGVEAGLAVVVGTTDGVLEAELTNGGRMLVHGLALSDEAAAKARQHIFAKKLYGLASVARVDSAKTLPYYDRIVNLVVADLDALGRDAPSAGEIQRVLGYEGVAYLKGDGKWTKIVKPTPKEVDNWGHYFHDASRNSVSKDLLVGPPNAVRWLGGPTGRNPIGGPRTSDGTFVQISNPYARPLRRKGGAKTVPWAPVDGVAIWARDVNSGVMLWYRVLSRLPVVNGGPTRWTSYAVDFAETFVAAGGRVYVYDFTNEEQVALTALNLRTGAVERVFDKSVVFRKADLPAPQPDARGRTPDWRTTAQAAFADTTVLVHEGKVIQALWDKVFVMDAASGEVIWQKDAAAGSNIAKALVSGDRLIALLVEPMKERFFRGLLASYVAVEAWHLKDGKPVWRFTDLKGLALCEDARRCYGFGSRDHHLLLPTEPVGKEAGKHRSLMLLDTRDGSKVWEKPVGMDQWTWAIIGDQIWNCRGSSGGVSDLATGKGLYNLGMPNTGNCSVGGGTPNYFIQKKVFFPIAQAGSRDRGKCPFYYLRTITQTCGENLCPSYGSVYNMPPVCRCENALSGTQAWYPLKPARAAVDDARLLKGAAAPLGAVERQSEALKFPGAFDWGLPDFHSGVFWRWDARGGEGCSIWAGYGCAQTAPVEAGDLSLVAHVQEHRLAGLRGGKEVWNFVAGGRIGSPPVIHQGLAIFGCHDGYVYAVNLVDGSPAWRFLAAPADRRHVVMNQVESVWPVFGVVLHEGKLYFSAGKHAELDGGVHFYCLDPATGQMKWHVKWLSGLSSDKHTPREMIRNEAGKLWDPERNKRIINDIVQVHDGKVWLFEMPVVDLAAPKDTIINPETLVPPGLGLSIKPDQVPGLIKGLTDRDLVTRLQAAVFLAQVGPAAKAAVPGLRVALGAEESVMRRVAARAIGSIGVVEPAIPELRKALSDKESDVREAAGEAIARAGKAAVPVLVELLGSPDRNIVRSAVRAVGLVGPEAGPACLPGLMRLLKAEVDEARQQHGSKEPRLRGTMYNHAVRGSVAVEVLGRMGVVAVKPVAACLEGGDEATVRFVLAVLERLGPQAQSAAPAVLNVLQSDPDEQQKICGAAVLGRLGSDTDAIIQALAANLSSANESLRRTCADALVRLGPKGQAALTAAR